MAQQRDISHDTLTSDPFQGRGYQIGRLLSQVFHPILLSIANFLLVGYFTATSGADGLKWVALCIIFLILPTTLFYTWRLRQGVYSDEDVSIRQQRNELYLFALVAMLAATLLLGFLGAPRPFLALMITFPILGLVGGLVNLFWKISAHSAAIASTATLSLLYSSTLGIALWVCALAVGWARVRTRNHTPMQVLAGLGSAALIVIAVFRIAGAV